jgi:hypothetical protein
MKKVAVSESSTLQKISSMKSAEKQRLGEIERSEKKLQKNANELKRRVDEIVKQLMQKLSYDKKTVTEVTNAMIKPLEQKLAEMQSFKSFSSELVAKGSPCDVTRAYKDLHSRAETLLKNNSKTDSNKLPAVDTTASDIADKMAKMNLELSTGELLMSICYCPSCRDGERLIVSASSSFTA